MRPTCAHHVPTIRPVDSLSPALSPVEGEAVVAAALRSAAGAHVELLEANGQLPHLTSSAGLSMWSVTAAEEKLDTTNDSCVRRTVVRRIRAKEGGSAACLCALNRAE